MTKLCRHCNVGKNEDCFEKGRNVCKLCRKTYLHNRRKKPDVIAPVIHLSGEVRTCITCDSEKPIEDFEQRADTGKRRNQCKLCRTTYVKQWKDMNIDKKVIPLCSECHETQTHKGRCFRCKQKDVMRERYGSDLNYKLKVLHRNRIYSAMKGYRIDLTKVENYLGCSWKHFVSWLEYMFEPDMTWENYGSHWHVDHVLPINQFDLNKEEHRRICFNWTNLQPKTQFDNCSKNDRIRFHEYFNVLISLHRFNNFHRLDSVYQNINESLCWLREETQR